MKRFLVFDVGCLECGESSQPVGLFSTEKEGKAAVVAYLTGGSWGRPEWHGQHDVDVYELEVTDEADHPHL